MRCLRISFFIGKLAPINSPPQQLKRWPLIKKFKWQTLIWGRQDPGGPHVGPMNFAIWNVHVERKRMPQE